VDVIDDDEERVRIRDRMMREYIVRCSGIREKVSTPPPTFLPAVALTTDRRAQVAELLTSLARPVEAAAYPAAAAAAAAAAAVSATAPPYHAGASAGLVASGSGVGITYGPVLTYKTANAIYQPARLASDPALASHFVAGAFGAAAAPAESSQSQRPPRTMATSRRVCIAAAVHRSVLTFACI
jgi:hypothetical protein